MTKCLISCTSHSSWDNAFCDSLHIISLVQHHSNSSPQTWVRNISRTLDVDLTHLRLGHHSLLNCNTCTWPPNPHFL